MSDQDSFDTENTIQTSLDNAGHITIDVQNHQHTVDDNSNASSSPQSHTSEKPIPIPRKSTFRNPAARRPTSNFIRFGRHVGKGVKGGFNQTKNFAFGVFEDVENFLRRGNMVDLMAGVVMG
ncbi:UNVERIFIED_CONTAM: hypothetical protein HDU68_011011 [Siphonaria sp. JEL0065]|nr:hypothetical protein HDU68_011011 [Siphonaria sp. JEL0065]